MYILRVILGACMFGAILHLVIDGAERLREYMESDEL